MLAIRLNITLSLGIILEAEKFEGIIMTRILVGLPHTTPTANT